MSTLAIIAIVVATALFFLPRLLPAVYYAPRRSFIVSASPGEAMRRMDPFHPGYESVSDSRRLADEQPEEPDLCIEESTAGPVLVRKLEPYDTSVRTVQPIDSETREPLFGEDSYSRVETEQLEDGTTRVTLEEKLAFYSPVEGLFFYPRYFRRYCRSAEIAIDQGKQMPVVVNDATTELIVFGVTLAAGTLVFGFTFTALLLAAVFVHELGHAIAYRLVGEKVLTIRFVPLVGAATYGTPPKTAMRDAFVSLAGALISSIVAIAAFIAIARLGIVDETQAATWYENETPQHLIVQGFIIIGILNLLNLLPVGTLDGGRALTSMLSGLPAWVNAVLQTLLAALILGPLIYVGAWILALWFGVSMIGLVHLFNRKEKIYEHPPASFLAAMGIALMYVGTVAITAFAMFLPLSASTGELLAELVDEPVAEQPVDENGNPVLPFATWVDHDRAEYDTDWAGAYLLRKSVYPASVAAGGRSISVDGHLAQVRGR